MASAQRIARAGASNRARKPSPVVLISCPPWAANCLRTSSSWRSSNSRHRRSPTCAARSVDETMSLNITVARMRSGSEPEGNGEVWPAANAPISRRVTPGESKASPPATARTPWSSSSGSLSLTRNPLAPTRKASNTYSSTSKVVRITIRVWSRCWSCTILRVASSPSILGMRMSISTTSGTRLMVRATAWSRPGLQLPTQRSHPFAHADDPLAAPGGAAPGGAALWRWAAAVVVDLHGELPVSVGDLHGRGGRPGVAGDVGERLLHDPERRHVDGERQPAYLAVGFGVDDQAGRGGLRHEVLEPSQGPGRGAGGRLPLLPEDVEDRAQLGQRLLAGLLDRRQRAAGLLGQLLVQVQRNPGLQADQRQVVAEGVVELPGDAEPLLAGSPPCLLLPHPRRLGGALPPDADPLGGAEQHQQP